MKPIFYVVFVVVFLRFCNFFSELMSSVCEKTDSRKSGAKFSSIVIFEFFSSLKKIRPVVIHPVYSLNKI